MRQIAAAVISFMTFLCHAQPNVQFTFPQEPYSICQGETTIFSNNSTGATNYLWDFCPETLEEQPEVIPLLSASDLNAGSSYKIVKDGDNWFAFFVNRNANRLLRFDFGVDPSSVPTMVDLGNPGGLLNSPEGIDLYFHDGNWYGFIGYNGDVLRLDFGPSLQNGSPGATRLNLPGPKRFADLKIVEQGSTLVLLTVVTQDNAIWRLNYGSSFLNVPVISAISVTSVEFPLGISIVNAAGNWIAHLTSFIQNGTTKFSITQLNFGSDILQAPSNEAQYNFPGVEKPYRIRFHQSGSDYIAVISNELKNISLVNFHDLNPSNPPSELPNAALPVGIAFDIMKFNGKTLIHANDLGSSSLKLISYEKVCSQTKSWSDEVEPTALAFSSPGSYKIDLIGANDHYRLSHATATLSVTGSMAPEISIANDFVCADSEIHFSVNTSADNIMSWSWDLAAAGTSVAQSPSAVFSIPAVYPIHISITDSNNCHARDTIQLSIYPSPVPNFSLPSTLLCTNNAFTFPTTTPDIYDGNLSYQWYVDDTPAGTDRDLQYTFTSTGTKDIKLVTSIPGCESEITKTTSSVEAGPVVDFSFEGVCEDDPFSFHNLTTDPVSGYLWDFANGNTSTNTDAQQVFTDYGDYPVSLTATNAAGCENITSKTVKVHARPVAAFLADGPPNSCSGTPTRLVDQSTTPNGDALTQWLWDFGDTSSDNIQTPTHIFSDAGRYNVSLTVTSAAGCSANVIQPVDIYQSPSTDFSFSPACDDLPVLFTPPADNSIVGWYWEIGTSYYTASSPTHTFKSPGNYPLYLEVTALNGCESSRHDVIAVPVALTPDFSYLKNCVGEEAVLTDVTTGSDPVESRDWTFDSGETFSGSPVKFVFDKELVKTVTMKVTAASGCSYSISKSITILPPPVAGFKPDPSSGAYPLEVAFTNTSSGATHYLWNFNDGTDAISTEVSPVHTFEGAGSYDVELIASNNQECTSSFKASIATVAPLPDADIELISLTPNADGSSKLIVTIHNKGNTILRNLPLDLDFGGVLRLREVLANRINPGAKFNFVFSTGIVNPSDLQYICVSSDVPNDISPAGNRMCQGLGDALQAFHAYPNPASGSLNIEWVQSGTKNIRLSLVDTMGRILIDARQTASDGLNRRALDLSAVESGIYYLVIRQDGIVTIQKIAVSTHP